MVCLLARVQEQDQGHLLSHNEKLMNINVDIYFRGDSVDDPKNIIRLLLDMRKQLMATLDELKAAVTENVTVGQSAITLLNGLTAKIQELVDAGADPAAIQEVLDAITADTQALSEAITANTPVVEEPPIA